MSKWIILTVDPDTEEGGLEEDGIDQFVFDSEEEAEHEAMEWNNAVETWCDDMEETPHVKYVVEEVDEEDIESYRV